MGVDAFLPILRPKSIGRGRDCLRNCAFCTLCKKASKPSLLNPSRLIKASACGKRNIRCLGLPGWPLGVTVPTSTKPNPKALKASMHWAFLSSPAASPTRLGKVSPASWIGSSILFCAYKHCKGVFCVLASKASVCSCATSASIENRKGRAHEYGKNDMDNLNL